LDIQTETKNIEIMAKNFLTQLQDLTSTVIGEIEDSLKLLNKEKITEEDGILEFFVYSTASENDITAILPDGTVESSIHSGATLRSLISDDIIPLADAISIFEDLERRMNE